MRARKLVALLLSLALVLVLLAGCSGSEKNDGKGDKNGSDAEESVVTVEDFLGCWQYEIYDLWISFYDDGTYEYYSPTGTHETGTYYLDGVELHLDVVGTYFVTDGEGGLMDEAGEHLFASQMPDMEPEPEANAEDFYGVWEYANQDVWVYIYGDGTYEWIAQGVLYSSSYYMNGAQLCLDAWDLSFTLDGEGNLIDSDGELLFQSELPDFYYEWDDEEDYSPTVTAEDFYGCWEYTDTYTWVYIYGDGTYEWYDSEGLEVMGNYYMFGDELCLEDSGMSFTLDGSGGLVDAFGDTLFLSELPQW